MYMFNRSGGGEQQSMSEFMKMGNKILEEETDDADQNDLDEEDESRSKPAKGESQQKSSMAAANSDFMFQMDKGKYFVKNFGKASFLFKSFFLIFQKEK